MIQIKMFYFYARNILFYNIFILQNVLLGILKIQQKTIENLCQLHLSENFVKNFTANCNCR